MDSVRWTLLTAALLVALAPAARSQIPPRASPDTSAVGSVRGEVYDSLARAALVGSTVRVQGTSLSATTDGGGRFRLEGVPAGRRVLVVDHPALDSIGLSGLLRSVDVAAESTTTVAVATPSLRTVAAAACPGRPLASLRDSGIVFGAVRDAELGMRLAHAQVTASWLEIRRGPGALRVTRRAVDVLTDSVGNYYACGVPRGAPLVVQAAAGPHRSGELDLEVGLRRVLRHDLTVSRQVWGEVVDSVGVVATRGGATLVGTVRNEAGLPLEAVLASVPGAAAGDALTDAAGRFALSGLPSGSQMLYVRRVGYRFSTIPVDLRNRDTTVVSIELQMFSMLDTLRVTATRWVRTEIDELERRMRLAGPGRVMREEELRAIGSIGTLFYNFPSLDVRTRVGGISLQMRQGAGSCAPDVWIDGWRSDLEVLQAYRPADLVALEVYHDMEVPMRYLGAFRSCGVILAWTRYLQ
jgi:Carboxypeptidase regulatory-like domain